MKKLIFVVAEELDNTDLVSFKYLGVARNESGKAPFQIYPETKEAPWGHAWPSKEDPNCILINFYKRGEHQLGGAFNLGENLDNQDFLNSFPEVASILCHVSVFEILSTMFGHLSGADVIEYRSTIPLTTH